MKILVTGFDPFGGEAVNPSWEAVRLLPDRIGGAQIIKRVLPTEFARSAEVLESALDETLPDVAVCIGQAGGRAAVTPERVAINLMDARIPDNAGCRPVDEPVFPGGRSAYFATLPVKDMARAMTSAGFPAALSCTAGTYVCNSVMYTLLRLADEKYPSMRGGFVHVPYSAEQTAEKPDGTPFMSVSDMARALECALAVL